MKRGREENREVCLMQEKEVGSSQWKDKRHGPGRVVHSKFFFLRRFELGMAGAKIKLTWTGVGGVQWT
jgi:hypothetical protein